MEDLCVSVYLPNQWAWEFLGCWHACVYVRIYMCACMYIYIYTQHCSILLPFGPRKRFSRQCLPSCLILASQSMQGSRERTVGVL